MQEVEYKKEKGCSIFKKLERCLSITRPTNAPTKNNSKAKAAPTGCFSVYVGPEKQRFVIKTEYANHPLFRMLLEDAESEYGFRSEGPLLLPCDVDLFCKVLAEMDSGEDQFDDHPARGCAYGSCSPFNPARRSVKGGGPYGRLTPSRLLKINRF